MALQFGHGNGSFDRAPVSPYQQHHAMQHQAAVVFQPPPAQPPPSAAAGYQGWREQQPGEAPQYAQSALHQHTNQYAQSALHPHTNQYAQSAWPPQQDEHNAHEHNAHQQYAQVAWAPPPQPQAAQIAEDRKGHNGWSDIPRPPDNTRNTQALDIIRLARMHLPMHDNVAENVATRPTHDQEANTRQHHTFPPTRDAWINPTPNFDHAGQNRSLQQAARQGSGETITITMNGELVRYPDVFQRTSESLIAARMHPNSSPEFRALARDSARFRQACVTMQEQQQMTSGLTGENVRLLPRIDHLQAQLDAQRVTERPREADTVTATLTPTPSETLAGHMANMHMHNQVSTPGGRPRWYGIQQHSMTPQLPPQQPSMAQLTKRCQ
jgi:hypothetical protein